MLARYEAVEILLSEPDRHDPAVAYSDTFMKIMVPGAGFVGGRKISLECIFLHSQEGV
jgi:hypothetical protein